MSENGIFVFNPLPWDRELSGLVAEHVVNPRGVSTDETSGRHFQDRDLQRRPVAGFTDVEGSSSVFDTNSYYLPKTTVSGYGYTIIPRERLKSVSEPSFDERSTVETERYVLTFDREQGGITSWYDKERDYEWVASDADQPLAGFVHEEVADESTDRPRKRLFDYGPEVEDHHAAVAGTLDTSRGFQSDWHAHRSGPEGVRCHRVYEMPERYEIWQVLATPQVESNVALRFVLPHDGETVIIDAQWDMGLRTHPEATYLAFPFNLEDPTPRLDIGGHAIEPGEDQLAESVYDYYTVQHWVDISDENRGMTVGCPLNPMVQFGGFHFAANQQSFDLERSLLLGWVTNNYWETNFRAHQPGRVRARYHLSPHDEFNEAAAHQAGMEATHYQPLTQTLGEGTVDNPPLSESGQLFDLPEPPILVIQIRPITADTGVFHPGAESSADREEEMLLSLRNASDRSQPFRIGAGELRIDTAARTDPAGQVIEEDLSVTNGGIKGTLKRRATATLKLEARLNE